MVRAMQKNEARIKQKQHNNECITTIVYAIVNATVTILSQESKEHMAMVTSCMHCSGTKIFYAYDVRLLSAKAQKRPVSHTIYYQSIILKWDKSVKQQTVASISNERLRKARKFPSCVSESVN
uniref:Uncharacterized protein n=1 Tax=Glossina austeni TaxID=7395 RepID=A0A1A9UFP6_GLOAU